MIIALIALKGGVGKTTSAFFFGVCRAAAHQTQCTNN